jgi:hypothetical protein
VGESEMIKSQMWKQNRSVMVVVHGTPRAIPPVTLTVTVTSLSELQLCLLEEVYESCIRNLN